MEKENAPESVVNAKKRAYFLKLENELRNEESTLLLLQQLRANQRSNALQSKNVKSTVTSQSTVCSTQSSVSQGIFSFLSLKLGRTSSNNGNTSNNQNYQSKNLSNSVSRSTHCRFMWF